VHILPEFLDLRGCTQPPEYHPEGDVWTHTILMLNHLHHPSVELALAVLLHDIGKPATRTEDGRIRFLGHAQVGARMTERWMRKMKFSNTVRQTVVGLVDRHMNFMNVPAMRPATLRKVVAHPDFETELELHRLDCLCSNGITETAERLRLERDAYEQDAALPEPWITGQQLLDMGLAPGPEIGRWKEQAYEEQLEGRFDNPAALKAWIQERIARG
jgi:poly(A) polymerase